MTDKTGTYQKDAACAASFVLLLLIAFADLYAMMNPITAYMMKEQMAAMIP